eukprot:gnl/TRDRNA2_/TRDRNA2_30889_c0_seq1.p1 gnl/TRDRNA2_/TRDRNA2_30889_c0~~gnl/TRDRNA2_/TRDRNA2_30889_c0_seq1.p1  ORF type:complete len:224 (+),score=9.49 gnl/TRDRNA2_/TRDRNA2_30889_c0_seq1:60-731(+)
MSSSRLMLTALWSVNGHTLLASASDDLPFACRIQQRSTAIAQAAREQVISQWVPQTMREFEQECEQAADRGDFRVHFTTPVQLIKSIWQKGIAGIVGSPIEALKKVTDLFEAELCTRGFIRAKVKPECSYICHDGDATKWGDCNDNTLMSLNFNRMLVRWSLRVSWEAVKAVDGNQAVFGGTILYCPICVQTAPGVALVPCGHGVCGSCARAIINGPCPCCRS